MSRWLLRINRKERFELVGPMGRSEVLRKIRDGAVELGDEACNENGYWFCFHESEELHKQLGISWSQVRKESEPGGTTTIAEDETDEITETGALKTQAAPPKASTDSGTTPVRQVSDLHPGPGSFLVEFFGKAPAWFWIVLFGWLLSVVYSLRGSTK